MVSIRLRKIERQVVGEDPMPELGLGAGDDLVGLRKLLDVVHAGEQRIVENLDGADLKHVQDHLRVLRVVLVPAVVQGLPRSRQGDRRHQLELEPGAGKVMRQGAMVVARRLEPDPDRPAVAGENATRRSKSAFVFVRVILRRRCLPGTAISTSCRCLEMSTPTRTRASGVVSVQAIAGLLCGVVRKNHHGDLKPGYGRLLRYLRRLRRRP